MADSLRLRKTANGGRQHNRSLAAEPSNRLAVDSILYCAYDLTRERSISTQVECADFPPIVLESRMATLTLGSGTGFWLSPYRGLPPASFRFPIDLVTLNQDHVVLEAIESYPVSRGSESGPPAASALAFPPGTIASVGLCAGDQLILDTPEQIKGHLSRLESANSTAAGAASDHRENQDSGGQDSAVTALGDRVHWEGESSGTVPEKSAAEDIDASPEPSSPAPNRAAMAEELGWNNPKPKAKAKKNWWQRWLSEDEPQDPRYAARKPLPWLAAYFLAGGISAAHGVRNISPSGLYVITAERWYLGTIIRMTLTDRREQGFERSIMVNAKVARWGNDGVGLQFLFRRKKDPPPPEQDIAAATTREQMVEFLGGYQDEHAADPS